MPLELLDEEWLAGRRIVMLEPRRLATRAAARRMAHLLGEQVGDTVGYQTRDERRIGSGTRLEVVTEGILTRRLQHDATLPGVGLVVFDEVHERNLPTDLGLALTLDVAANLRPDLRVLAMSATPDTERLAVVLGGAPVIASTGRQFDVDIRWLPQGRHARLEPAMVSVVQRALVEESGDVLAFLPGVGEINRTLSALRDVVGSDVDLFPLAGALTLAEQDAALAPSPTGRRRVVLTTDIAETSLTVDGVRVVVDSGLARAPRFDVRTGMTRLTTVSTSRASADQRAGRAGRTGPGACYRLWSKLEHGTRQPHRPAEITEVDLAGLALELAAWHAEPDQLAFIDRPPPKAFAAARNLLAELGALDHRGTTRDKLPEMPTQRGHTEKRGARGDRGPAGPTGPRGPAGPVMAPADILAVVEDQFYDVRKRLDAQLTRTAEVQQQLEGQRKEIAELRRTVNLAHRLLKELLAKIP